MMTSMRTKHLPPAPTRFGAAAATYDQHASVQLLVAQELIRVMQRMPMAPHHLLDAGCGTGLLTGLLCRAYPSTAITAVDSAAAMIDVAREKPAVQGRVQWLVTALEDHTPSRLYDGIASSATLQWLHPLEPVFAHLAEALVDGGVLAVAVMTEDTLKELHALRREIAPDKQPARRLPDHRAFESAIHQAGLSLCAAEKNTYVTEHDDAMALLRSLHEQGVTGGLVSRGARPLSRGELSELAARYEARHRTATGSVPAHYAVSFFLAKKAGRPA